MRQKRLELIVIAFVLSITTIYSQVGINNNYPKGVLHVDAMGNNTASTTAGSPEAADDVFLDESGRLGIGTLSPLAKLDVKGQIQIIDGFQAAGNVYTSIDNKGTGQWKPVIPMAIWNVTHPDMQMPVRDPHTLREPIPDDGQAVSKFLMNNINFTSTPTTLNIPAGKYLIILTGEFTTIKEILQIYLEVDGGVTSRRMKVYYDSSPGATFYLDTPTDAVGRLVMMTRNESGQYPDYTYRPFDGPIDFTLMFYKLN